MGECSFGRGFGQVGSGEAEVDDAEQKIWKDIPHAIMNGMAKRYRVSFFTLT